MGNKETQPPNTPETHETAIIRRVPLLHAGIGWHAIARIVPRPENHEPPQSRGITLGTSVPEAAFDEL